MHNHLLLFACFGNLKVIPCIFLDILKLAKVAATFEIGWMFSCANSFKNISRAHMQGAEMSTVEKRFLSFKIYTEKYLLYWQRIAIWAVATYGTKISSCIS